MFGEVAFAFLCGQGLERLREQRSQFLEKWVARIEAIETRSTLQRTRQGPRPFETLELALRHVLRESVEGSRDGLGSLSGRLQ